MTAMTNTVPSPCTDVCKMDPETDLCQGCHRTRDEIKRWKTMDDAERQRLMKELPHRKSD